MSILASDFATRIQELAAQSEADLESVGFPMIMQKAPGVITSDWLVESAQIAGAQREYASAAMVSIRSRLMAATQMAIVQRMELEQAHDRVVIEQISRLISRSLSWEERKSHTRLGVLEEEIRLRAAEAQLAKLADFAKSAEDAQRAWRDTEWALERQLKLMQLRHALGEV